MTETVKHPHPALLQTLMQIAHRHGKTYCYPSHATIRRLTAQCHHWAPSARTLCRHIAAAQRDMYFVKTRRHRRANDGHLILRSSLYKLGLRAFQMVARWSRTLALWPDCITPFRKQTAVPQTALNQRLFL